MFNLYFILFIFSVNLIGITISGNVDIDPNGYIAYCPCMGRFGNQADHFLGSLGFAYNLNRTLILPPWVEYRFGELKSTQIPFDTYFKIEPLREYHRVITMEQFMSDLAPKIWPDGNRTAFCYMSRTGKDSNVGCNAKEGNPFGPFWDTFNINFSSSEFYSPLHYDTYNNDIKSKWNSKYPGHKWPVLAFTGAPASFPVQLEYRNLHKYLKWSDFVLEKARRFIKTNLPKASFIGIHLRNGMDWVRACDHIKQTPNLFSAPQCLGYRNERGVATTEMCLPSKDLIIKQIKRQIKSVNLKSVKSIFVGSDSNHMLQELNSALKRMRVGVYKLESPDPHVELAIMGLANHFIGNCISSFTAFVKRDRDSSGLPSSFWGYPTEKSSLVHEEL